MTRPAETGERTEYRVMAPGSGQHGSLSYSLRDAELVLQFAPPYSRIEQRTVTPWLLVPLNPKKGGES